MRAPTITTSAFLVSLVLSGCAADTSGHPLAPSAGSLARSGAAGDVRAANDKREWRIRGTLEARESGVPQPGTPIVVRHLEGEGRASHLGRFTTVGDFTLNLATASGGGTATYTAANGDLLTATTTGQAVVAAGIATVTETVTITGGTGRFAGASGTLTVVRRIVQATGLSAGTMDGTIVVPK